jgi:hypothetical protein
MTIRTLIRKCLPLLLVASLAFAFAPRKSRAQSSYGNTFAFWYEDWKPGTTINKLQAANIIVGVQPGALPEIHKSGRRALQYITYYQARFDTAFLKGADDLPNVGFQLNGEFVKSRFGGANNYVLCPNSVELKNRVLRFLDTSMQQGYDGYFLDNTYLDPAAHGICSARHQHINPGVTGGSSYVSLVAAVREKLKTSNPSALLILNPGNPASLASIAPDAKPLWDLPDYVLWESFGYSSLRGPHHDDWKHTLSIAYGLNPDQRSKIIALSFPENVAEARFSFAVARIFGLKWTANLGEKQQGKNDDGGHFGAFLNDLPTGLGEPLGALPDKSSLLLHRTFQYGEVFANTGSSRQAIALPRFGRVYVGDQLEGTTASRKLILEPMTAAFVVNKP